MNKKISELLGMSLLVTLMLSYFHLFNTPKKTTEPVQLPQEQLHTRSKELRDKVVKKKGLQRDDVILENECLHITFSRLGGHIKQVILKKHKDQEGSPLVLLNSNSGIGYRIPTERGVIKTSECVFEASNLHTKVAGDKQTRLSFTYHLPSKGNEKRRITHTFTLSGNSYQLDHQLAVDGIDFKAVPGAALQFIWYQGVNNLEKDPDISRKETTLYYHLAKGNKVSYLKAHNTKEIAKEMEQPLTWICTSHKFYLAGIIADERTPFIDGTLLSNPVKDPANKELIKEIGIKLSMAQKARKRASHHLRFYFGPKDYTLLQGVAPKFEENYYLGFPPIKQFSKYVILPITKFMEKHVGNYLLILLILILILKIFQLPFAYHTYRFNVKKKALQPLIAKVKEQYKDDPTRGQMEQLQLQRKAGIGLGPIIPTLLQIPIFFSILNFIRYNIGFRQVSFLWMQDLSAYDDLIKLPFHVPMLGSHISLIALIASIAMIIPLWFKKRGEEASSQERIFQFILPLLLFFVFNSFSAAWHLYRLITQVVDLIPTLIFRLTVDEAPIKQEVMERLAQSTKASKVPRAHARYTKRKNNNTT